MSSRFDITETPLSGLIVLGRKPMGDSRGWLERLFCATELATVLGGRSIVQINRSHTALRGTVRGMHFQTSPHAEMKIVSCLCGEVLDVAVDLRPESPTRHQWHGEILSGQNRKTLVIPEGFAHGFQTLTDDCEMLYFHTAAYYPEGEDGLHPLDPALAIAWPLEIASISARDAAHSKIHPASESQKS